MAKKKNKDELEAVAKETEPAKDEELTPVTDEEFEEIMKEILDAFDKNLEEIKKGPEPELDDLTKELLAAETTEECAKILNKHNVTLWCE